MENLIFILDAHKIDALQKFQIHEPEMEVSPQQFHFANETDIILVALDMDSETPEKQSSKEVFIEQPDRNAGDIVGHDVTKGVNNSSEEPEHVTKDVSIEDHPRKYI